MGGQLWNAERLQHGSMHLPATAAEHISDVVAGCIGHPRFWDPHQAPSRAMCLHLQEGSRSGRTLPEYIRLLSVDEVAEDEEVLPTVGRVAGAVAIQGAMGDLAEDVRT